MFRTIMHVIFLVIGAVYVVICTPSKFECLVFIGMVTILSYLVSIDGKEDKK